MRGIDHGRNADFHYSLILSFSLREKESHIAVVGCRATIIVQRSSPIVIGSGRISGF
jgi:hypothetical protein